jgi:3-oxoadipate enol-lactonase
LALEPRTTTPAQPRGRALYLAGSSPTWVWEMDGPPGAPAIMLLHGWMATAALNWYRSLPYLGARFRVVAPNLRGHGREGRASSPFSLDGCSDDLAALIDGLRLQGVIVVGYSMGGAVAQVLARRHRQLLGGIVLCATAGTFARRARLRPLVRGCGALTAGASRAWPDGAAAVLRWRLRRHDRAVALRRAHARLGDGEAAVERGRQPANWVLEERALSHLAAFIEAGAELNAYDSTGWLPSLDLPAAAVITERDRVVAPGRQEAMATLIPGCKKHAIDAGHDAVVARSDIFLPLLAQACAELAPDAQSRPR